jgi:hypothetical protein
MAGARAVGMRHIWAADVRRNCAELTGTAGQIELDGDILTVTGHGSERRWSVPPPVSDGSWHPDWFDPVVDQFLAEVTGSAPRGSNLAEASVCVALHALAHESSRRGARSLPLAAPTASMEPSV